MGDPKNGEKAEKTDKAEKLDEKAEKLAKAEKLDAKAEKLDEKVEKAEKAEKAEADKKSDSTREKIVLGLIVVAALFGIYRCTRDPNKSDGQDAAEAGAMSPVTSSSSPYGSANETPREPLGLSAPIAAANVGGGDVVVAGLDVPAKAIRVQRINSKDEITGDRVALSDVAWSSDSDLRVAASSDGIAVTWRGLRRGKLVRQLVLLAPDLASRGEPMEVAAASCSTRDAIWFSDGSHAMARPFVSAEEAGAAASASLRIELPKEKDASLICGLHRVYALLEEEERTSILGLGALGAVGAADAGAANGAPITVVRENDFGEDEQRELSEYTVGDDVGVVRLAASGALMLREVAAGSGVAGPMHRLKTSIPKDDDVVAVDASSRIVVIVYTQDASSACPPGGPGGGGPGDSVASTKVTALRVDRQTFEESTVELSPGRCGHEVGPFFNGALGEGVSIGWSERAGGLGKARAPIVGLAHALVQPTGTPELARIEQSADAMVDALCDGTTCFAAALVRRDEKNAMAPGIAKILRYK